MNRFLQNLILAVSLVTMIGLAPAQAQKFSATLNLAGFNVDRISSPNTQVDYTGSSSVSANFRVYSENKWAIRAGAGVDNLKFTVDNFDVDTEYSARRQDLKGILGLEKHFIIGDFLDIYPGAYVPIIVVGENVLNNNYQNLTNGGVRSGLGVVLGANIKLFKILRVGVEFDASYNNFREAVWESASTSSFVPMRGIAHTTNFTVGVAF